VIDLLHGPRFQDDTPRQVYAVLLDEGQYHCSIRIMYRILKAEHGDVKERRKGHQRTSYQKPELLATAPNQVWSWDITKLKGPAKWTYFYLYVILDIFSRYVVGWMVVYGEHKALAKVSGKLLTISTRTFIMQESIIQMIFPNLLLTPNVKLVNPIIPDDDEKQNTELIYNNKLFAMILYELGYIRFQTRPLS